MTSYLIGVDVGWLESVVPGIEAMAAALPDDCARCKVCGRPAPWGCCTTVAGPDVPQRRRRLLR